MSKKNGNNGQVHEFQFPQAEKKQTMGEFFHNSKDGTFFGRTPKNWGQLMAFYVIFYIVLGAMFTICMQGLFSTLNDDVPKWQLEESLIGTNPGLGFRPISEQTERGSVIAFNTQKPEEGRYWKELIEGFLKQYKGDGRKEVFCEFNRTHNPLDVCAVDVEAFGNCSEAHGYGYNHGRPCVFLKLNRIFGWVPQFYDDITDLPEEMPQDLREHIGNTTQLERQQIWVSCSGHHSQDKEILGEVNYYPNRGFAAYYYPYLNQKGYVSPLIAVQFPNLTQGQLISVECRAWAKNIVYGVNANRGRTGSVTFQFRLN